MEVLRYFGRRAHQVLTVRTLTLSGHFRFCGVSHFVTNPNVGRFSPFFCHRAKVGAITDTNFARFGLFPTFPGGRRNQ